MNSLKFALFFEGSNNSIQYHSPLEKMSWENSQLDQSKIPDWAETYSAQLRSYPCHPSSTMTELFLNLFKNYQAFHFSCVIEVWFNESISHTLIGKSKNVDFNMILMYLNMTLLNCEAKVSFDFWTNFTYFGQSV